MHPSHHLRKLHKSSISTPYVLWCVHCHLVQGQCLLDCMLHQCTWRLHLGKPDVQVVSQLLDALQYMHSQSFCHRDLKLENLLVEQGTLRLKVGPAQDALPTEQTAQVRAQQQRCCS